MTQSGNRSLSDAPEKPRGTSFFGRVTELAELTRSTERAGVVAIVGPPGVGKTRLAIELFKRQTSRPSFWCDLQQAVPNDWVRFTAAQVLVDDNVSLMSREQMIARLSSATRRLDRPLFVLDNFESVLSASELIFDLTFAVPHATVLITSRYLPTEVDHHLIRLEPLPIDVATQYYKQVAKEQNIEPSLEQVVAGVQASGGLPLGIELFVRANASTDNASTDTISNTGAATSLGDIAKRSFQLLSPREQIVLSAASVLGNVFNIRTLAEVCHRSEADCRVAVLELCRASLAHRVGSADFSLYPLVKESAQTTFAAEVAHLQNRQLRRLASACERLGSEGVTDWSKRISRIEGELQQAVESAIAMEAKLLTEHQALAAVSAALLEQAWQRGMSANEIGNLNEIDKVITPPLSVLRPLLALRSKVDPQTTSAVETVLNGNLPSELAVEFQVILAECYYFQRQLDACVQKSVEVIKTCERTGRTDEILARARVMLACCYGHKGFSELGLEEALLAYEAARVNGWPRVLHVATQVVAQIQFGRGREVDLIRMVEESGGADILGVGGAPTMALAYARSGSDAKARAVLKLFNRARLPPGVQLLFQLVELAIEISAPSNLAQLVREPSPMSEFRMTDTVLMRELLIAIALFRLRQSDAALKHLERVTEDVRTTFPDAKESLESMGALSAAMMSGDLTRAKLVELAASAALQNWGGRIITGLFENLVEHLWVLDSRELIAHLPNHDVDLSAHPQLWRVLCVLAEGALTEDGTAQGLASIEIFERAWPGERVSAESADDRVRSSVYKLRKLGLDPGLRSERHGYFLDPAIVVAWRNRERAST